MDILDNEASEDEAARKDTPLNRLPSHEANVELIEKERRYRNILSQAAASDEVVRQKWDDWENNIVELTWTEVSPLKPSHNIFDLYHLFFFTISRKSSKPLSHPRLSLLLFNRQHMVPRPRPMLALCVCYLNH